MMRMDEAVDGKRAVADRLCAAHIALHVAWADLCIFGAEGMELLAADESLTRAERLLRGRPTATNLGD
jgi:hypothetical protein